MCGATGVDFQSYLIDCVLSVNNIFHNHIIYLTQELVHRSLPQLVFCVQNQNFDEKNFLQVKVSEPVIEPPTPVVLKWN